METRTWSSYLPPAVQLSRESLPFFRQFEGGKFPGDNRTGPHSPTCKMGNYSTIASGLGFTCQYDRLSLNHTLLAPDVSKFSIPLDSCGGTSSQPFRAQNYAGTLLQGNFSPDAADLTWNGQFKGSFGSSKGDFLYGSFSIRFKGSVDREHSHEMNLGPDGDKSVHWVENRTLIEENTFCAARSAGNTIRAASARATFVVFLMSMLAVASRGLGY